MVGLHKTITLSFLIVGHTKFSPDSCFGLLKQKFRKTIVNCLDDIVNVVESSAAVNMAQLVGAQSGEVIVPSYDWVTYLGQYFVKIQGIKSLHHFHFDSSQPGFVHVQAFSTTSKVQHTILIDKNRMPDKTELPNLITPVGLSTDRQWYLYNKIREYCSDTTKDLVCPYPGPGEHPPSPSLCSLAPPSPHPPASSSTGKRRACSHCGEEGHNMRTCKRKKVFKNIKHS